MNNFKVSDLIIAKSGSRITVGSIYKVLREYILDGDNFIDILNDKNEIEGYFSHRFTLDYIKPKRNLPSWF